MKLLSLLFSCALFAQQPQMGKPDPEGDALYRSNCAFCHGLSGKGGRGPDLTARRVHGNTDADVSRVIKQGIPGTTMPAFANFENDEVAKLVGYLKSFSQQGGGANAAKLTGDVAAGKLVYQRSGCTGCHKVDGVGSIYGPDLSRIGVARSQAYIAESLAKPSADVPLEWEGVSVTLKDGRKVTGVKVNEDSFTLQMRDPAGKFRFFDRSEVKSVAVETKSLMPAYDRLPKPDLDNLLAYLDSLRGNINASGPATKAKGIQ
jgi:cytochrome c oxidase cbb3-type subunit 3